MDYSSTPISIRLDGVGWTSDRPGGRTQNRALISDWARIDFGNAPEGFGHEPLGLNIAFVDGSVRFKRDPNLMANAPNNNIPRSVSDFWDSGYLEE